MKKYKIILPVVIIIIFLSLSVWYLHGVNIPVLNPKGPIAQKEFNLMMFALLLSLVVVIPVFTLTGIFVWKYREGNTKAKYSPDFDHSNIIETIWWIIPSALIFVLSVVAWNSSHQLDPFKPISSSVKPITIQVIALDWKWLFIYPEQGIATVNYIEVPSKTPLNFEITSDTVMNSFWIPQLGGQIYAMPGMSTELHLLASENGMYNGSSANISGQGFAGMTFTANAVSSSDFNIWVKGVKNSYLSLNQNTYDDLSMPSENNPVVYYSRSSQNLFSNTINKYMTANMQSDLSSSSQGYSSSNSEMVMQ